MIRHRFAVRLTVQGPVLSRAVATSALGIDALGLRDRSGHPALPGTLLRGMLRQAWDVLGVEPALTRRYFGIEPRPAQQTDKEPAAFRRPRAPLRFAEHFVAALAVSRDGFRHRIRVEPDTGAVTGGGLVLIESLFAPGQHVDFTGWVEIRLPAEASDDAPADASPESAGAELAQVRRLLEKGFAWLPAVGAHKGVGFGSVLAAEVAPARPYVPNLDTATILPAGCRASLNAERPAPLNLGLRILPEAPFCFPLPGPKGSLGNRFRSSEFIPGAALKAALAAVWPKGRLRERYLDPMRITRALPAHGDERPLAIPASLALVGSGLDTDLADFALHPALAEQQDPAPRFAVDWKAAHRKLARERCGWPRDDPERGLVVRNAIDPDTGTVDFDPATDGGLLFSLETIIPDRHQWLANLSIPGIAAADREPLIDLLEELLRPGLGPLGKTRVFAAVRAAPKPWRFAGTGVADRLLLDDDRCVLSLQSPALLLPRDLPLSSVNGDTDLRKAYADAFADCSAGSLRLLDYFATQSLGGGNYWWRGFRRMTEPYRPVLLTEPGSVFVLAAEVGRRDDAGRCLAEWLARGIPPLGLSAPAHLAGLPEWQRHPWLRENGYGEVALNTNLHPVTPPRATGVFAAEDQS